MSELKVEPNELKIATIFERIFLWQGADQMRRFDRYSAAFARSRFTADVSCARMASGDIANPASW